MEPSGHPPRPDEPGPEDEAPLPPWYLPSADQPEEGELPLEGEEEPAGRHDPWAPPPPETGPPPLSPTPWTPPSASPPLAPGSVPLPPPIPPSPLAARGEQGLPGEGEASPGEAPADLEPEVAEEDDLRAWLRAGEAPPAEASEAELAAAAGEEGLPAWSRAREAEPAAPDAAEAEPPADEIAAPWTTIPPGAPSHPYHAAPPRSFGDRMAAGVLLSLAAGSLAGGGIFALQQASEWSFTMRAIVCGGVAAVLLAAAVVLRLVRGTEDVRGTLAFVGIAFAAACVAFAYDPTDPTNHDNLVKFSLVAGIVAVLGWFAAVVVPSAVAGLLGAVALPAAVGAGVWLGWAEPTHVEVYVAALCIGLVLTVALTRIRLLRPHPTGLGWALGGTALVIAVPAGEIMARNDAIALAAGATASAGLLVLAQLHRHLPSALGAFLGLAYLEAVLIVRHIGDAQGSTVQTVQLITVVIVGGVIALLAGAAVVMASRGARRWRWPLPVTLAELFFVAALVLALLALFTGPGDVPFTPTQLQPGATATLVTSAAAQL